MDNGEARSLTVRVIHFAHRLRHADNMISELER